jgi:methyl acetate hydrolase
MTQLDHVTQLTRRDFGKRAGIAASAIGTCAAKLGGLAVLSGPSRLRAAAPGIGETLRAGMERRKIPAVAAAVASATQVIYEGGFGTRDAASGVTPGVSSIFAIASMTKPVTSVAAMQLVEQGKLKLDEPVSRYLPQLANLQVLTGFDADSGKPQLRPAVKPATLRRLLTHTSGFVYDTWDAEMLKYESAPGVAPLPSGGVPPLAFEPGARWQYGTGVDWAGRLVEKVSGLTLEQYFQSNIFSPLGMQDTSFILAPQKFDRLVSTYQRENAPESDGVLKENPRTQPAPPTSFSGGGGLYSTASDYVRFMQMILRHGAITGRLLGREKKEERDRGWGRVLRAETVSTMTRNQIGNLSAGKLKSVRPNQSADCDFHPGYTDGFGLGFLINSTAYEDGRSAGSLAWAGIQNTFFWIDPKQHVCAVVLMHFLPFCDPQAVGLLGDFERAAYAELSA